MSYCVNCGVELDRSLKQCPLCETPVINPKEPAVPDAAPMLPRDELKKKDRTFWMGFFTLLYLVPILTCAICNLVYDKQITWSVYVSAGILMAWAMTTSPFYFTRPDWRKLLCVDFAALLLGLLIIQIMAGGSWFARIAAPIVAYIFILTFVFVSLGEKGRVHGLILSAFCVLGAAVLSLLVELLVDAYMQDGIRLVWSWFVFAPCVSIAALLTMLDKNKKFRQELAKRLHV